MLSSSLRHGVLSGAGLRSSFVLVSGARGLSYTHQRWKLSSGGLNGEPNPLPDIVVSPPGGSSFK